MYGAARRGDPLLTNRVEEIIREAAVVLPFDEAAARIYGRLKADLESGGKALAEPDLRIACIVLANDLVLVTGNARHFGRIENLTVENWLAQ